MTWAAISQFLKLYPVGTRRALKLAWALSFVLALVDFLSLLLLLPVFSALAAGGGTTTRLPMPLGELSSRLGTRRLLVFAMSLLVFRSVSGFIYRFWWSGRVVEAEVVLSSRLLNGYAFAPYAFHLRRNSADLLSRVVAHVNVATTSGLNGLVLLVTDGTTVLALSGALFVANPTAGAAVCAYLALVGSLFILVSRRFVTRQTTQFGQDVAQVYRRATTVLRGIRELTVAGGRESVLASIDQARLRMVRSQRNMLVLNDVPRLILEVALYAAILVALLFVLAGTQREQRLPVVALYVMAGLRMVPAIGHALGSLTQARTGLDMGLQVSRELRDVQTAGAQKHRDAGVLPRQAELVLSQISFAYDAERLVLDAVNVEIPYGTFVAIVGASGSGKSTLLGIMLGLLQPDSGRVTYGGQDVGLADAEWLGHVAYVPQEVFVLDDSVLCNVALGDRHPDGGRVWGALRLAALAAVVEQMPAGLDTALGESGSRLSVGQRQRLGIARALYRNPAVLILDEPTAALDTTTEAEVMATINTLSSSLTIVIVAHRLQTIASVDRLIRLEDGKLVEASMAAPEFAASEPEAG